MPAIDVLMNPAVLNLIIGVAPVLIEDIKALFAKHPALTPEALAALAASVYAANADTRSTVAADLAAHPAKES